jgi:hypothetical protein
MPKNWNPLNVQAAFTKALGDAVNDAQLRSDLLDPTKAKSALAAAGDITVPDAVEIVFYRQEDFPARLVVAIPADPNNTGGPNQPPEPLRPNFMDCFLCTYETYVKTDEAADNTLHAALDNML